MVLEKIPTFEEVKAWAQNQGWVKEDEVSDLATKIYTNSERPEQADDGDLWYPPKSPPEEIRLNVEDENFTAHDSTNIGRMRIFNRSDNFVTVLGKDSDIFEGITFSEPGDLVFVEFSADSTVIDYVEIPYSSYVKGSLKYNEANDEYYFFDGRAEGEFTNSFGLVILDAEQMTYSIQADFNPEDFNLGITLSARLEGDFAYSPDSGYLYYVDRDEDRYDPLLVSVDTEDNSGRWLKQPDGSISTYFVFLNRYENKDYVVTPWQENDGDDRGINIIEEDGTENEYVETTNTSTLNVDVLEDENIFYIGGSDWQDNRVTLFIDDSGYEIETWYTNREPTAINVFDGSLFGEDNPQLLVYVSAYETLYRAELTDGGKDFNEIWSVSLTDDPELTSSNTSTIGLFESQGTMYATIGDTIVNAETGVELVNDRLRRDMNGTRWLTVSDDVVVSQTDEILYIYDQTPREQPYVRVGDSWVTT